MKILAALDLTDNAKAVMQKAVEAAKQQNAQLVLLTVAEDFLDLGDVMDTAGVTDKLYKAAAQAVEAAKAVAKDAGVEAEGVVKQGVSPADLIVEYAGEIGAGLIVLGSRGKKGIERFLLGSVAGKIVTHAPCSVLVIR
ncbi:Putative universal stress protein [Fundidesulfovibrio magnetotacticus]|uniref:Universal stress protein n=1 Tax=Fundidesulfovibrio magnetotacticus TaxID=2730080 RepID=A0A6V8LN65_9BACT|nr:universal stress protein [Fundidesulfovibrio magnetotacticus]GFK94093.1 Putative universal stress protein [Fundidesulfovibrio magnetotacticus]